MEREIVPISLPCRLTYPQLSRITSIDFRDADKTAVIQFEKPSAAKTALMVRRLAKCRKASRLVLIFQLNGGALDGATLSVTSDVPPPDEEDVHKEGTPLQQSDKPRAGSTLSFSAFSYRSSVVASRGGISCEGIHPF